MFMITADGNEKMDDIKRRLETIISILINQSNFQGSTLGEKILFLAAQGYQNQEIAAILNASSNLVAKEKSRAKKGRKNE